MDAGSRIEKTLEAALSRVTASDAPPQLAQAMRHAVFPGGARVRPQLCLAVAAAFDDPCPAASVGFAAALELLHCASLVHDDMPCFDDADRRRSRPTVHVRFGEPLALLAGDALIVLAFETVARGAIGVPMRTGALIQILAQAVGMPRGIVAGQGWESENSPDLQRYHAQKTGALFVGATVGGAIAAGGDPGPWRAVGEKLGQAYQVADDLADVFGAEEVVGKPCGQDCGHDRPNAVARQGVAATIAQLERLVTEAADAIPDCAGSDSLRDLVILQAKRLAPKTAAVTAA